MIRQYSNQGRDQINVETIQGDFILHREERSREEQILLKIVRNEVKTRLTASLHNAVFLNLNKEFQPDQINCPWDREVKLGGAKVVTPISDNTTITQVFDSPQINGKLLILGQPGSGKTMMLLELAKALLDKAEEDVNYPIPVLLNLSRWKDEKQPISDWLVEELKSKYGVSLKLGQLWVRGRILLPLLDGLDEVASERQKKCVQQINHFLSGEAAPLYAVVCSRIAEYQNYEASLELNGAVYLKELSDKQIQKYLIEVDRQQLWALLAQNSELLTLARAPLLLSMMVLAYCQDWAEQWQQIQTTSDQLEYLLDKYVEQMLHSNTKSNVYNRSKAPKPRQTRFWLNWLAEQMEQTSQTEFLIEDMQPSMLPLGQQEKYRQMLCVPSEIKPVEVLNWSWIGSWQEFIRTGQLTKVTFGSVDIKTVPNQGIKRSIKNCLFWGPFAGLVFGLRFGPWIGLFIGLVSGLYVGGGACTQHFVLRWLLYRNKLVPWNYAQFLDYCTERLLLQRVGGRYRFVHKLLQEYFAKMPSTARL